jgi:hypothetical protein
MCDLKQPGTLRHRSRHRIVGRKRARAISSYIKGCDLRRLSLLQWNSIRENLICTNLPLAYVSLTSKNRPQLDLIPKAILCGDCRLG